MGIKRSAFQGATSREIFKWVYASYGASHEAEWTSGVNWGPAIGDVIRGHSCSSKQTCGRTKAVVTPIFTHEETEDQIG